MEGTNKAHENGEAMGFVGVRLTAQLGAPLIAWLASLTDVPLYTGHVHEHV